MRAWQNGLSSSARWVEHPNQSQLNPGPRGDGYPVTVRVIEFDFRPCWPPEGASDARTPRGGAHSPTWKQMSKHYWQL